MRTISFGGVVIFCFISLVWGQVQRVCGPNNKVVATETIIDSEVIWMQWMGKNNKVVYAWSQLYTLYRSTDEGKTWADQTDKFDGVKNFYYIQPTANESKLYFPTGKPPHYRVWTSSDEGASLTELKALADYGIGCAVYYILPHPSEQDVALLYGQSVKCTQASTKQCYNEVHFTRDFGKTWTLLDTYVDQVSWGKLIRDDDGNVIHMYVLYTAFMEKKGVQDRISRDKLAFVRNDLIKTTSGQVLYQGVSHMLKSPDNDSYLYLSETTSEGKQLLVSEDDGETFVVAKFPLELEENGYTILDDTDGSVFVNVQHNDGSYGNIYISDDFGYSFGLSLKNNKKSYSYYTFYGGCDFEKMKGLDGIYVANVFDQSGSQVTTNIKTMITYDMGGVWTRLRPPVNDSRGQPINCVGDCYLNLFGINELVYGRFYSVPNSVALMVATGNVGSYLDRRNDYVNAYISRDAGFSWIELGKGSFTYEISEHGSLLLYAKNTEETNEIYYTWNEGLTNETCVFSDRVMDVTNIVVEPTFTSKQFFLYGSRGSNGVIVHIDLSALHPAACKSPEKAGQPDSDYERWSPSDAGYADEAKECILGAHTVYARKKQTSRCFNPPDFNPVLSVTPCDCVREDYDCDFCFEPADDGTCVLACEDYDPTAAPTECGSYYYVSKGYRLISGTRCQGGLDLRPVKTTCPGYKPNGSGSKGGLSGGAVFAIIIIFLASIALAAIVGIFLVMKFEKPEFIYEKLKDIKLFQRNPGRTKGSSYFHVGQDKEVESPFLVDDSVN